jgi:hypothetical protein
LNAVCLGEGLGVPVHAGGLEDGEQPLDERVLVFQAAVVSPPVVVELLLVVACACAVMCVYVRVCVCGGVQVTRESAKWCCWVDVLHVVWSVAHLVNVDTVGEGGRLAGVEHPIYARTSWGSSEVWSQSNSK